MYDSKLTVRLTKRTLRQILELRTLALGKTEKLPLYSRQWYYDSANRAHIKLAKMPRDDTAQKKQYYSLKYSEDTVVYDPEAEAMIFHTFFAQQYSLPDTLPANPHESNKILHNFLSSCDLPKLPLEALDFLKTLIMAKEVEEVLRLLPSGKSSGPDGFTYLYCQTFRDLFIPSLTPLYNTFLERWPIPLNMLHSYITMIPKPNRDPVGLIKL